MSVNINMKLQLSDAAVNIIENLACRIAEKNGGRITANHLIPYLPVSLDIIKTCLDNMVDDVSVSAEKNEQWVEYEFAAYRDSVKTPGNLNVSSCLACDADMKFSGSMVICPMCFDTLKAELNRLAERTGWPAQAVYEHEILHIAAEQGNFVPAAKLAGYSIYTLKNMRKKLDKLTLNGYVSSSVDDSMGIMTYQFPEINYPKGLYKKNMSIIHTYPASVMEEIQMKVTRILFSLGILFLCMLGLAFMRIPFPILIVMFLIIAPMISLAIWRHKKKPQEE